MDGFISVGKILNFHGIKGEAKVGYSKNRPGFIANLEYVFVKDGSNYKRLDIISVRQNKNFLIAKFKGIDDIDALLKYKGALIFTEEKTVRDNLEEDEFLIDELVGMDVLDISDKNKLGFVIGVSNNGASDLLSIKTRTGNVCLVPFVKAIVPEVSIKDRKIYINNIEGLLE